MSFHLKRTEKLEFLLVGVMCLIPMVIGFVVWRVLGPAAIIASVGVAVGMVVIAQLELFQRRRQDYRQIEAMFSLFSVIKPVRPLPPMRDWAVSPDFANIVVREVLNRKPKTILEYGSGISTLLMSYCVKNSQHGHIWSLDHDEEYVRLTKDLLKSHNVEDVSTVLFAPLKGITLSGESWLWYDTAPLDTIGPVDLVVVDGPPKRTQKMARYPALFMLAKFLNEDAIIILDDASEKHLRDAVKQWKQDFKELQYDYYDTEKGAIIITGVGSARAGLPAATDL